MFKNKKKEKLIYYNKDMFDIHKRRLRGYIGICISEKEYKKFIKNIFSLGYMKNIPFDPDGFHCSNCQEKYLNNINNVLDEQYVENINIFKIVQKYLCDLHAQNHINILTDKNKCINDIVQYIILPYICNYNEIIHKLNILYLYEFQFNSSRNFSNELYTFCKYKDGLLYELKYDHEHYIFIGFDIEDDGFDETIFKSYSEKLRDIFGSLFNKSPIRYLNTVRVR